MEIGKQTERYPLHSQQYLPWNTLKGNLRLKNWWDV